MVAYLKTVSIILSNPTTMADINILRLKPSMIDARGSTTVAGKLHGKIKFYFIGYIELIDANVIEPFETYNPRLLNVPIIYSNFFPGF